MIKCLLIYLWIYIGLFYMIEAGDDDEHVHIKLHMRSGQRKRTQIQQHTHQHHKKRHTASSPQHHQRHHNHHHEHDSPHNYLTAITATASSATLEPQNHVFQPAHTKKFPSSTPLNLHDSGQLFNMEEEVFGQGDVGSEAVVSVDTNGGEPMIIPSYMTKNFASFPQPTTTYETEIIPHNSEGFNVVSADGQEEIEEDNEITAPAGRAKGSLKSIILDEQIKNYKRHKPSPSSSTKIVKNEQLLQQLLQQQHNEQPEIINAATAAYKSAKLRGNKYKSENDYHSEDDMKEAMMYSPSALGTRQHSLQSLNRPTEDVDHSGSIKPLTVDDIWSQLQQQYLNKYTPQAQPLTSSDNDEQLFTTTPTKTKNKRKRNTKGQRHAKPTTTTISYSTVWPAKPLSYSGNKHHNRHHLQPIKQQQQQHYYGDIHSSPSAAAFSSLPSHRDADFFIRRPLIKLNAHNDEDDTTEETDEDTAAETGDSGEDEEFDVYGDESFEQNVYQRGKKFTGHTAYGQHSHANNPFNNFDLYGSYSTPVTATVATNIQPSTYHPNLVSSTAPSFTSSTTNEFLPTISHPSTSYQWRTQENYPASYQTYHLQHQQQQPKWTTGDQYAEQYSSNPLRLPTATIVQTPNLITSSNISPSQSNDFTVSSSSSLSAKSTAQPPARYKKRKNRIKPKRNRIVVI